MAHHYLRCAIFSPDAYNNKAFSLYVLREEATTFKAIEITA